MMISENIASAFQDVLYLTSLDGYCPDSFIGGRRNERPNNASELWKNSVELIYRCLVCDLLEIDSGWAQAMNLIAPKIFAEKLAQHDPFDLNDFNDNGATYWLEPLLYATEKLKILLSKYKINNLDQGVCVDFISEIECIFEKYKIPWGSNFIFP